MPFQIRSKVFIRAAFCAMCFESFACACQFHSSNSWRILCIVPQSVQPTNKPQGCGLMYWFFTSGSLNNSLLHSVFSGRLELVLSSVRTLTLGDTGTSGDTVVSVELGFTGEAIGRGGMSSASETNSPGLRFMIEWYVSKMNDEEGNAHDKIELTQI